MEDEYKWINEYDDKENIQLLKEIYNEIIDLKEEVTKLKKQLKGEINEN